MFNFTPNTLAPQWANQSTSFQGMAPGFAPQMAQSPMMNRNYSFFNHPAFQPQTQPQYSLGMPQPAPSPIHTPQVMPQPTFNVGVPQAQQQGPTQYTNPYTMPAVQSPIASQGGTQTVGGVIPQFNPVTGQMPNFSSQQQQQQATQQLMSQLKINGQYMGIPAQGGSINTNGQPLTGMNAFNNMTGMSGAPMNSIMTSNGMSGMMPQATFNM